MWLYLDYVRTILDIKEYYFIADKIIMRNAISMRLVSQIKLVFLRDYDESIS